jgi:hypothetical protein
MPTPWTRTLQDLDRDVHEVCRRIESLVTELAKAGPSKRATQWWDDRLRGLYQLDEQRNRLWAERREMIAAN